MSDPNRETFINYGRIGHRVVFKTGNVSNHEMRAYITALWNLLDEDDRTDQIAELLHYNTDPNARLPEMATVLKDLWVQEQRGGVPPDTTHRRGAVGE